MFGAAAPVLVEISGGCHKSYLLHHEREKMKKTPTTELEQRAEQFLKDHKVSRDGAPAWALYVQFTLNELISSLESIGDLMASSAVVPLDKDFCGLVVSKLKKLREERDALLEKHA